MSKSYGKFKCVTKKSYADMNSAKSGADKYKRCNGTNLKPYVCDICGKYHLATIKGEYK